MRFDGHLTSAEHALVDSDAGVGSGGVEHARASRRNGRSPPLPARRASPIRARRVAATDQRCVKPVQASLEERAPDAGKPQQPSPPRDTAPAPEGDYRLAAAWLAAVLAWCAALRFGLVWITAAPGAVLCICVLTVAAA